uniref:ATIp n=1 Tax=Ectromelia virus TaxID=12643 RepID=A0A8D9FU97_9POXV|nr:ATIp [Ectromelia virus]
MEVTNLIEKCTKHSKDFATEVEKLWNDELSSESCLSRKTRNVIRNILRDITNSLITNKKTTCFKILENSTVNGEPIKDAYNTIFNNGVDLVSSVNTTGKYVLFTVMTYAAAELQLIDPDELTSLLSRLFNTICDIHSKYGCGNMFVGVPATIIILLDIDHINKLFSVFSTRYKANAYLYNEFFLFLNINHNLIISDSEPFINIAYGPASFSTPISVPDYIMEALTFKACDHIIKSGDLKYTYVFTKKYKDLFNTKSDSIYQYVRLHEMSYDGVTEDTDDEDDVFAILNLSIDSSIDRYRNRVLLLTPEVVSLRKEYSEVEPDYRYLMDKEVDIYDKYSHTSGGMDIGTKGVESIDSGESPSNGGDSTRHNPDNAKPMPYNTADNDITIVRSALAIADYQLVINKLTEWLDKCEEECGNGGEEFTRELEEAKKKLNDMNKELSDKLGKIRTLERDSVYKNERIEQLTNEIKELRDMGGGSNNCSALAEIDKKTIKELRESLDREREMRAELEKELDTIRNGKVDGSCQRELELSRMWLKQRDEDLRVEIDKRRDAERELSRLRRDITECNQYKEDLDKANITIMTYTNRVTSLESEIARYQQNLSVAHRELEDERRNTRDLENKLNECMRNQENTQEVEALRSRIKDLENKLSDCMDNGGNNITEINRLKSRITDLERQLTDCRRNNDHNADTKKEMERLRNRIMDLDKQLNECRRNGNGSSSEEIDRLKNRIKDLKQQLEYCESHNGTNEDIIKYKKEIESLKRDLADCRRHNNGSHGYCTYFDEEARSEVKRLRRELTQLHEDLRRARESDKNDSYYKRELERQRVKVVEVEKELEKYFNDRRLEDCKRHGEEMLIKIADLERKLRDCGNGGSGNCHSVCDFERKRIAVLEAELRRCMETIKVLEKFVEFDRLQKDYSDKFDRERERRMKAEHDLEREIARKDCGGVQCERELQLERSNVKKLEYQLDAEKEKVKFYKRELERDRYLSKCNITDSGVDVLALDTKVHDNEVVTSEDTMPKSPTPSTDKPHVTSPVDTLEVSQHPEDPSTDKSHSTSHPMDNTLPEHPSSGSQVPSIPQPPPHVINNPPHDPIWGELQEEAYDVSAYLLPIST